MGNDERTTKIRVIVSSKLSPFLFTKPRHLIPVIMNFSIPSAGIKKKNSSSSSRSGFAHY